MPVPYTPIGVPNSTFKQPRQKIWGVFMRPTGNMTDVWELVLTTNSLDEATNKINEFLINPPQGGRTGLDNVILSEIAPIDASIRLA